MTLDIATVIRATDADVLRRHSSIEPCLGLLSPADLSRELSAVTIDSRTVTPGALFVALPGEQADGHQFVGAALAGGARAALVARGADRAALADALRSAGPGDRYLLLVADPLTALQRLAADWRERHNASVVGITGSIGKTTTKELVAGVLATKWPVLRNKANFNTEIGLPLTLLGLRPEHRAAVLEMGMYARGDISLLARIARPDIGIVTNVAPIHLERLGTIARIARAKSELPAALGSDALAILNGDDEWTRAMALSSTIARVLTVGEAPDCDVRAEGVTSHGLDGISFVLRAEGETIPIRTTVPGTHLVHAWLVACTVARHLGMTWDEIATAMADVRLESRQRILQHGDLMVIDDAYNAAPQSMRAALDLLAQAPGTRVAVLGDMLELGPEEESAHREVGAYAAGIAEWLVTRGERARWIAQGATEAGLAPDRIISVGDNLEAVEAVRRIAARAPVTVVATNGPRMQRSTGDGMCAVLVKGSRGMRMEEVVEGLTA